jgi:hypothetical protein
MSHFSLKTSMAFLFTVISLLGTGCTSTAPAPSMRVNAIISLASGEQHSWRLEKGQYHLEMTASGNGVAVHWVGAVCQGVKESPIFSGDCTMPQTGQLVIEKPSFLGLGLGKGASVTLKLSYLPLEK